MRERICLWSVLLLIGTSFPVAHAVAAADERDPKEAPKPPPAAPTERIGNIRFTTPADWEKSEKKGFAILNPKDVKPTDCSIVLVSGEQLKGDFLQWFKKKWTAFAKDLTVIEGGERTTQEGP